ncbi:DUF6461 domain-containing protein [Streptomyces sp. NPDC018964]|uniref:DUF6461 domain-containing protein n=1 Tax=Streptomyces sp. NPDC018964 TaxID=3365058 RepID=UPI0037B8A9CA
MPGSWRLADSQHFCLTFCRNRSPEEVLARYGADADSARPLPAKSAPSALLRGTTLRVGLLGEWSFCVEFENYIGCTKTIMRDLSAGTEALLLFQTEKGLTVFSYVVDGRVVEKFEPGCPPSARGRSAHAFARRTEALISTGTSRTTACLEVMAQHTGHELTTDILHGPLLTAVIDEVDQAALAHPDPPLLYPDDVPPSSPRPLGRPLGHLLPVTGRARESGNLFGGCDDR